MKSFERMFYILIAICFIVFMIQYHPDILLTIVEVVGAIIAIIVVVLLFGVVG